MNEVNRVDQSTGMLVLRNSLDDAGDISTGNFCQLFEYLADPEFTFRSFPKCGCLRTWNPQEIVFKALWKVACVDFEFDFTACLKKRRRIWRDSDMWDASLRR